MTKPTKSKERVLQPHTRVYEPEYAIKNDDGTVFYHRPTIELRSNSVKVKIENCPNVGMKQTKELLKNIINDLDSNKLK